jgi:2-desacetyl-2-hydroxyethyl bacteriochlorophyllide A dehydrogenase
MKAAVLKAPGQLVLDEITPPSPVTGRVLVRVTHTGVCGTDLKIYNGSIPVPYPLVMGHEIAGDVVEAGGNRGIRAGDRVVVDPFLYCGLCFQCRAGQTNLCPNGMLLGRDVNGGFAEYISVPASHVFRLPDTIDNQTAPLIQVMTTCLHAQRLANLFAGESVVVMGLGVSGQLMVQLAKARGANPVIGLSRSPSKGELARKLGADLVFVPGEGTAEAVLDATDGRGADLVIESTGVPASVAGAINLARTGGRVLLFGIITATEAALPFYQLYFKELTVINARAAKGEDFAGCINLLQRGMVRLEPLVSHVMPLEKLETVIGMLGSGGGQRLKVILDHS